MARMTDEVEDQAVAGLEKDKIVQEAIKRWKITSKYHNRQGRQADDDNRFAAGTTVNSYQWNPKDKRDREDAGLTALTVNVIPKFLADIEGELRMNRARIKFLPTGGTSTKKVADIYEGIARKIERDSKAEDIYDFAGNRMLTMGMGYAELEIDYKSPSSFHKRILIKPVLDSNSILPDPRIYDLDKEKMRYCFKSKWILKDDYKELYGDKIEPVNWSGGTPIEGADWYQDKSVRISHYYRLVSSKVTMVELSTGAVMEKERAIEEIERLKLALSSAAANNPMAAKLSLSGTIKAPEIVDEKEMDVDKVEMYIIDGVRVLEGPFKIPGNMIPIAGCYGRMDLIDGVKYTKGLVRDIRTLQVRLNYWISQEVDTMSTRSRAQFWATVTQMKGLSEFYRNSNKISTLCLPYRFAEEPDAPGKVAPPPIPIAPPTVDPQMMAMVNESINQMRMITGFGEPMQVDQGDAAESGKALLIRQKTIDKGMYVWIDNHAKFITQVGRIMKGMIPEVYCEQTMERILGLDGSEQDVLINGVEKDPLLDIEYRINDLSAGDYDIEADTGPNFTTKRVEMKEDIKEFMSLYKEEGFALSDIYARNSDWPESEEIAERMGYMIDQKLPGMRKPDPKKPPRQMPQTPQMQVLQAELQSKMITAKSKAQEAQSKAELAKLKIAEESAKLGMDSDKFKTLVLAILQEVLHEGAPGQDQPQQQNSFFNQPQP